MSDEASSLIRHSSESSCTSHGLDVASSATEGADILAAANKCFLAHQALHLVRVRTWMISCTCETNSKKNATILTNDMAADTATSDAIDRALRNAFVCSSCGLPKRTHNDDRWTCDTPADKECCDATMMGECLLCGSEACFEASRHDHLRWCEESQGAVYRMCEDCDASLAELIIAPAVATRPPLSKVYALLDPKDEAALADEWHWQCATCGRYYIDQTEAVAK
jgi:hypothetical protein